MTTVSVLIIKPEWLKMIQDGKKVWEIRHAPVNKDGQYIYLAGCGTSAISTKVKFVTSHGPLSTAEWAANAERHCVPIDAALTLPYKKTYAWQFSEVEVAKHPIPFQRVPGAQIFQDLTIACEALTEAFQKC